MSNHPALLVLVAASFVAGCGEIRDLEADPDAAPASDPDAAPPEETAATCGRATSRTEMMNELEGIAVVERFEIPVIPSLDFRPCAGPLSAATAADCAGPGDVQRGFEIVDSSGDAGVYRDFSTDTPGQWAGPGEPFVGRAVEIRLEEPQARVGLDALADARVVITALDADGEVLSSEVVDAPFERRFLGTRCDQPVIDRVRLDPEFGLVLLDELIIDGGA